MAANGNRIIWTAEMLSALRDLRRRGVPLSRCADELGVCVAVVTAEAHRRGLADRRNRGRLRGEQVVERSGMST